MTRVLTSLIEASSVVRAVSISDTFRIWIRNHRFFLGSAGDQRIAHPAWRTRALGVVVLDTARGGRSTRVLVQARVGTLVVDTGRGL